MQRRSTAELIRAGLCAGLAAGIVLAVLELAIALRGGGLGLALGGVTILCIDLSLGLLLGSVQSLVLLALVRWDQLERAGRWTGRALAAVVRPADPAREASRVARLLAAVVVAGAIAAGWFTLARGGMQRASLDALAFSGDAGIAVGFAAIVLGLAPGLVRALTPAVARLPRLATVRVVVIGLAAAGLAASVLGRHPIADFLRAVDIRPLALAAVLVAADVAALLAIAGGARARRLADRATGRIAVAGLAIALALSWLVALGPASRSPGALRVYRSKAPLTRIVVRVLAAQLDGDGDTYSAFFGDGDCAPSDPLRNPGAFDVPGNGVDDDCFDGDRAVDAVDPFAPPAPRALPPAVPAELSFVLIVVDTLRADHLTIYGYPRDTSPNLARLAGRAVVFERAYAPSAYTYGSVPAMLTSKFPTMLPHEILRKRGKIRADDVTLPELLAAGGWDTAIVTDDGAVLSGMDLLRGFLRRTTLRDDADAVAAQSVATIEQMKARKFLLVSYFIGPHSPYLSHPDVPRFGSSLMDRYDHEIADVDRAIGVLLDRLDQPDLRDRVVVIVTSDHGESFGEHGTYYHGHHLHEENVRVPLIIAAPGAAPRRLGAEPVSVLDVTPTIVHLARLPIPPVVRGHELSGEVFAGEEHAGRHVFLESHFTGYGADRAYQAAVVTRDEKLIEDAGSRTYQLYDLARDPGERRDLADDRPDRVLELRRALRLFQGHGRETAR